MKEGPLKQPIRFVQSVSDGILVEFSDGTCGYFNAEFLRSNLNHELNSVFLNYDPSPPAEFETISGQMDRPFAPLREAVSH